MNSSPVRHPGFFLLCILALFGAVAARQHNPVKSQVMERIQSRYVSDSASCLQLSGPARRHCKAMAVRRFEVALAEFDRLQQEATDPVAAPITRAPPTVALALGASPS